MAPQTAPSFPAEEYFEFLLQRAQRAQQEGNYGIAAALVIRHAGRDLLVFGVNTLFTERNPCGHAEVNAILSARRLALGDRSSSAACLSRLITQGEAMLRPAPSDQNGSVLYTTLEPCPMCTVCILNAGIDRVVIAAPDPPSGVLSPERFDALPSLWQELGANLDVLWTQSVRPQELHTYLPPALRSRLIEVFATSRQTFDVWLGEAGVLDLDAIRHTIADYRPDDASPAAIAADQMK